MPAGAPFESHIPPYDQIRVDSFTGTTYRPAWINLLSHIHSDHTQGLSAPTFSSRVVCSEDSKKMLLLVESVDDRINYDKGIITYKKRTFAALKRDGRNHRDLLQVVALNKPTKLDAGPSEVATITLLDANHCPGSVMFLIEGRRGAVLHTGDIRAEPAMVSRLAKSPQLAPYLLSSNGLQEKQLETLFLDTASMIGTRVVPSKANAVEGLLEMISMYPQDTQFYINTWTWGYEDILIGIAEHFNTKIHVDRFKYTVLISLSNYVPSPSFSGRSEFYSFANILTCEEATTRFHACERFNQCNTIKATNFEPPKRRTHRASMVKPEPVKRSVYINPGVVAADKWETYILDVKEQLQEGEFVDTLRVPLSRHSTLTELQSFVAALRPKNIYPNTLVPHLDGLDWACLPGIFAQYLTPDGYETLRRSSLDGLRSQFPDIDLSRDGMKKRAEQVLRKISHPDPEQENAVGSTDEVEWSEARLERAEKTREHIETYLPWLFGRQDALDSTTAGHSIVLRNSPGIDTAPATKSGDLCLSCASCPTCAPNPNPRPTTENVGARETAQNSAPGPRARIDTSRSGISSEHVASVPPLPAQRNDQMHSPPPESSLELRRRKHPRSPAPNTASTVSEEPSKRRRLQSQPSSFHSAQALMMNPLAADSSSGLALALGPTQAISELDSDLPVSGPREQSTGFAMKVGAKTAMIESSLPGKSASPSDAPGPHALKPDQTIIESPDADKPYNYNIQRSKSTDPALPIGQSPSPSASKPTVSLSDSDRHEQRRFSKLKERSIRAQIAKLPVEFSQALAATKSTSRIRSDTPVARTGLTKTYSAKK